MWKFGSKWSVGVDLGSESVKIVCLAQTGKTYNLVSYGMFYREHVEAIRETLSHPNLQKANLRVSIKDSLVKIRKLELPPAPADELTQMVQMALGQQLAGPIENYILRYQPLQKAVFIAERKQVDDYLVELKQWGILNPAVVEPRLNSLALAALHNHPIQAGERLAIVDIGRGTALFAVVSNEGLLFGRNLSDADGEDLFKQIANRMGSSVEEVDRRKRADPAFLTLQNPDAKEPIIQWLYKVAVEIQNSVENYELQFPNQKVTGLILAGGASKISGLSGYVQDTLKLSATYIDAFARVNTSGFPVENFGEQGHFYAAAVGLAL
ncbi:MAG: pilus assembly protein PilM [Myxococcota bacterium]